MATETGPSLAASGATSTPHTIPPTAILATEKVYLRRYEASDAEAMSSAANDPELAKYLRSRFPSPYTLSDAESFIAHCASLPAEHALTFGMFTLESGEVAGTVSLEPPKGDPIYHGTRELGYWVARKFWGRGIMTDAVRALTRWAFANVPDLLRVEATVFEGNEASARVLAKVGFTKEGTRRLAIVKDGKQMSEDMYGLIRTDVEA
ncbi:acetyltransferase [Xylaria arbuscula]|nr:acetyltransferase [Xylaria arbuscula]